MHPIDEHDEKEWPPGTVRLEDLQQAGKNGEVILQPRPSRDPNDPLNWPRWEKYLNFGLVSFYAMMVFALIDAATPTWAPMNEQLGFSYAILNDSYAVGNGTLCIGAFLLIPFALKYGRRPMYIVSTAAQLGVSIWSAKLETVADIMLINAFSCGVGALAEVIVQMTVADMFFVHERGTMNSFYVWAQNIGGSLAPVAAGYITVSQGWRWVWWWCTIFFGVALVAYIFLYEETKYDHSAIQGVDLRASQDPVAEFGQTASDEEASIEKKTDLSEAKLEPRTSRGSAGPEAYRSRHLSVIDIDSSIPRKSYVQRLAFWTSSPGPLSHFFRHSYQPFLVLFTIPGVFFVSLTYGALIAMSTVQVTTLSSWMAEPPYNFNAAQIGLMSLPSWIGSTLGALVVGPLSDWLIVYLARRNHGIYEPEMRLWVIVAFIPFVPAGLFMFGIGLNNGSSWPVVAIGYGLASFGTLPASSLSLTYLTDAYTEIVGDALVGVTFTRNLLATIFVFVLTPWIANMGIKNVFIIIGVLVTAVLLGTFIFIYYGKKFRVKFAGRYRYYAARQYQSRPV
ncbi:hypothetical protein MMC26_000940 [Xylographa opegraphella]|nr:hypothetical protein [Xylographa opegraphella]